ncbi:MAG: 3-hydroxyacyl-CoA dehydrogenase family protein [Candidatus Abyssubacteria bacterium]
MDAKDVKKVLVVGAGVMGHGIAQVCAQDGIAVNLADVNREALERAIRLMRNNLSTLVEAGKVFSGDIPAIIERIRIFTDLDVAVAGVDFVLEAVTEVPSVKKELFTKLDAICSPETVFASNTSSLDVFDIAPDVRPERMVITHWFAPPHIIPLVEVVPGPKTAPEVTALALDLMKRLGKRPIVMKQFAPSFIVNRIQNAIGMAVWDILQNGWATPEEVDRAVKLSLGIRLPVVGVAQTLDFTGLDLVYQIVRNFGIDNELLKEKVAKGHLGAKTSKGLYDYRGRTEEEILKKRDLLYLKLLDHLDQIQAFEPI